MLLEATVAKQIDKYDKVSKEYCKHFGELSTLKRTEVDENITQSLHIGNSKQIWCGKS